jgi:hypothetical protein
MPVRKISAKIKNGVFFILDTSFGKCGVC